MESISGRFYTVGAGSEIRGLSGFVKKLAVHERKENRQPPACS